MQRYYRSRAEYPDGAVEHDVSRVVNRSLRSASKMLFSMRRPISEGYNKAPTNRECVLWNIKPEDLKQSISKLQFKWKLKHIVDFRFPKKQ